MQPILIAVGIGNTTIQAGATGSADWPPAWQSRWELATRGFDPQQFVPHLPMEPCQWRIASVHRHSESRLAEWVRRVRPQDCYLALSHTDLPLEIKVKQPSRVGMDRLVAAIAAGRLRREGCPAIVIDAGTALTVDLVDRDGSFAGGAILPGMQMVARALAADTDLLPEVAARFPQDPPPVGKSTEAAIHSGLFWGTVGATRELVSRIFEQLGQSPQVFVTGGDARRLAVHLGPTARFVPDLVLAGIAGCGGSRESRVESRESEDC